ncbi:MAG: TolC family protein, partial [bacterium]
QLELNRQMLTVLADLEAVAEARNAAGQATLQDVLRAQIEQERIKAMIANLEDARAPVLAKFKAALGLAPDQSAPPVMATPFPSTPLNLDTNKLLAEALARNPELQGMTAEIRLAESGIKLARLTAVPDFTAGLEADLKMSPILLRPRADMTLPIWRDKIAADLAAAQAGKRAATARLTAGQIALAVEFADLSYQISESGRNLQLFQTNLLPKAKQALEIARDAYRTGGVDFQTVQENQRLGLEFGLAAAEAREQHDRALAELSLVVLARPPPDAPLAK